MPAAPTRTAKWYDGCLVRRGRSRSLKIPRPDPG